VFFFNNENPDDSGIIVDIPFFKYETFNTIGFEINVENIPNGVNVIKIEHPK
jgi:hypothetical protein